MRIKENQYCIIFCKQDPLVNAKINRSDFNEIEIFLVTSNINSVVTLYV